MITSARPPAKVNLSLLVGPPAPDGYHPLSTVFVPVDLHDEIEFDLTAAPAGTSCGAGPSGITVDCPGIGPGSNLVTRAVRTVEELTGWALSGTIRVRKVIPIGAGLGGGSSDAAATLRAAAAVVEESGGPRVEGPALAAAARALGADVPFFLDPAPALAAGVGDLLEPLLLPALPLVLVLPERELSTAEVYRAFDATAEGEPLEGFEERRRRNEAAWRALGRDESGAGAGTWAAPSGGRGPAAPSARRDPAAAPGGPPVGLSTVRAVASLLENDLERASFRLMPELAAVKSAVLEAGALGALMSGSGPTVFGLFGSEEQAGLAARELERTGRKARAVVTALP